MSRYMNYSNTSKQITNTVSIASPDRYGLIGCCVMWSARVMVRCVSH